MSSKNKSRVPTKITLTIDCCKDCPKVIIDRTERAGFAFDYFCSLVEDKKKGYHKKIMSYIEYSNELIGVPKWCPLR
jgi:hypothetical protein